MLFRNKNLFWRESAVSKILLLYRHNVFLRLAGCHFDATSRLLIREFSESWSDFGFRLLPLLLWDHLFPSLGLPSLPLACRSAEKSKEVFYCGDFRRFPLEFCAVGTGGVHQKRGGLEGLLGETALCMPLCTLEFYGKTFSADCDLLSASINQKNEHFLLISVGYWHVKLICRIRVTVCFSMPASTTLLWKCYACWVTDDEKAWHLIQSISVSLDSIMCKTSSAQRCMSNPGALVLPLQKYIISFPAAKQKTKQMQYQI